jgi:hypothetical protein
MMGMINGNTTVYIIRPVVMIFLRRQRSCIQKEFLEGAVGRTALFYHHLLLHKSLCPRLPFFHLRENISFVLTFGTAWLAIDISLYNISSRCVDQKKGQEAGNMGANGILVTDSIGMVFQATNDEHCGVARTKSFP